MWPALSGRHAFVAAAGVLAAAVNIVAVTLFARVAPYLDFLELARMAAVGVAFAVAALVLLFAGVGRRRASWVLVVASLCWAAGPLAIGVSDDTRWWIPLGALTAMVMPCVVWLVLAYPASRLGNLPRSALVCLAIGVAMATIASQVLMADPGSWGWCVCATNPFAVATNPSTYLRTQEWLQLLESGVVVATTMAFGSHQLRRRRAWAGSDAAMGLGVLGLASSLVALSALEAFTYVQAPEILGITRDVSLIAIAGSFVVPLFRLRPSRAHVADMVLAAREGMEPVRLRYLIARALGDPQVVVHWWDVKQESFVDGRGNLVSTDDVARGVNDDVIQVEAAGYPVARVIRDARIDVPASVIDSVVEALRLAAENRRLTEELRSTLEQVRESRARIVAASDETRRQIERDLHDGAQQLLVSTGIKLRIAERQAGELSDPDLAVALEEASDELNRALARLRQLASGIAPTSLVHGGLAAALDELALGSAVATTVEVKGDAQLADAVAQTIYFVVAECLTNIAKHAAASHAQVVVDLADPLQVRVSDDGHGGASLAGGTGLRGLSDRVEALGGALVVRSTSHGTEVTATVPQIVAPAVGLP